MLIKTEKSPNMQLIQKDTNIYCCDISVTHITISASVAKNGRAPAPINVWKKCGRMPVMSVSAWDYASVTLTECPVLSWLLPNVKVDL